MSLPVIGYDNIAQRSDAVITTGGGNPAAAGYDEENAATGMTWDKWMPTNAGPTTCDLIVTINGGATSVPVDYLAISTHNLKTVGVTSLKLQKDIGAGWVDVVDATARVVTGDKPIFITFTQASSAKWRVLIDYPTAVPYIAVISLGARLDIPQGMGIGWTPPNLSNNDTFINHVSEGGAFIGRSLKMRGVEGKLDFDLLAPSWVRTYWAPFVEVARTKPFFICWDETNYPGEAAYCWADKRIDDPFYSYPLHMRAVLSYQGLAS